LLISPAISDIGMLATCAERKSELKIVPFSIKAMLKTVKDRKSIKLKILIPRPFKKLISFS
jgi:hypothetical protein